MIRLENLCKTYRIGGTRKVIADRINAVFPDRTIIGILGRNGAGKSTLLRMIAGTQAYDSGRILRTGTVSWPVGFGGGYHGDLSAAQNVRFVARIAGVDGDELVRFVEDFAEIGHHFHLPMRTYSSGMRGRITFGVSMGIHFDTYLVDEATATGDATVRDKALAMFEALLERSGVVMVTHSLGFVRKACQQAYVLSDGTLTHYTDVQAAIEHHLAIMAAVRERNRASRGVGG